VPLSPPVPLADPHRFEDFNSGEASLDDWLKRRARANQASGATRTYVACEGERVIAYYALASGAITVASVTGRFRRNMPDPIPVMVIGRLAVDRAFHGRGIGRGLLRDAILRTSQAARIVGIRAILVHALSDEARQFYERSGFRASPIDPMMLMISVAEAEREIQRAH